MDRCRGRWAGGRWPSVGRRLVWRQLAERADHAVAGVCDAGPGEGVDDTLGVVVPRLDLHHDPEGVDPDHADGLADAWSPGVARFLRHVVPPMLCSRPKYGLHGAAPGRP